MKRPAGRPQATSRAELSNLAIDLFIERGFEETSVDDVAAAGGIARRTLFRYFPSKNAIPWGDFDSHLAKMRLRLRNTPAGLPLGEALRRALIDFNDVPDVEHEHHRRRMQLLLGVPALQAHSMLMYAEWRQIVAEYVAGRLGMRPDGHIPQTVAWQLLGVSLAAYERWLADPSSDLLALLDEGCTVLTHGLSALDA
ncbi:MULTISPECIES: mycofactocin system transcriptional regulator [unclassified Gordonia (in: high G+C Gram-positive bacteria)]|uniref:mycofactocin system transcriptional regulator n=1 Tax=unclassified Gordonia (in: high G+C Gram-positive bacteria) TaxID=2657482 RepID=UPI001FFF1957|nr:MULTISPECIES: mycofactocin system transcriptional regulator [unclassified Gordonia (in: high G+C Gram-positive bacteria)]UQE74467.1 mycofactocin system transcriptional regulator [Gordonia sp. PP30]